jgi:hypothetical protein
MPTDVNFPPLHATKSGAVTADAVSLVARSHHLWEFTMHARRLALHAVTLCTCAAMLLSLTGCLEGLKSTRIRYDKDKDEFTILSVYQQIRSSQAADTDAAKDLTHLKNLYTNRDHMIIGNPMPVFMGTEHGLLRLSPNTFADFDLCQSPSTPVIAQKTKAPLNAVKIMPGAFFGRGDDCLGYFHQVTIPGVMLDLMLADADYLKKNGFFHNLVQRERDIRNKLGEYKPATWDDVKASLGKFVSAGILGNMDLRAGLDLGRDNPNTDKLPMEMRLPLSDETLAAWDKAMTAGDIAATRTGRVVSIKLPMTAEEAKGFQQAIADVRKDMTEKLDKWAKDAASKATEKKVSFDSAKAWRENADKALGSLEVKIDKDGATLAVDLMALLNVVGGTPQGPLPALEESAGNRAGWMVQNAGKEITIDKMISIEKVVADFDAGKLKSNPSDKPVEPGTDLSVKPAENGAKP